MAAIWHVTIDVSKLIAAQQQLSDEVRTAVHNAVNHVGLAVFASWQDAVQKAPLWVQEKDAYLQSIGFRFTGEFSAEVWTDYKVAEQIETGRPARDLKRMLETSMKVRVSAKGKRYLIIPFRHNMTALQAVGAYPKAKGLAASSVTGQGFRPSGTGALDVGTHKPFLVPSRTYSWGGALPAGLVPKLKAHHTTDPLAGLRRFNTSAGAGKSSAYLTFRVMMEGSPKWIVPARPGMYIAQKVATEFEAKAPAIFAAALQGAS